MVAMATGVKNQSKKKRKNVHTYDICYGGWLLHFPLNGNDHFIISLSAHIERLRNCSICPSEFSHLIWQQLIINHFLYFHDHESVLVVLV